MNEHDLGAEEVISQVSKPLADVNVSIMYVASLDNLFSIVFARYHMDGVYSKGYLSSQRLQRSKA